MLPNPFPTPDWSLDPANYPSVFLVDNHWASTSAFKVGSFSLTTQALQAGQLFNTPSETDNHGEKTRHVVQTIAVGLTDEKLKLISVERENLLENHVQLTSNLPEALLSVQLSATQGDLVIINVGSDGGRESFARDPLVAILLNSLTDALGVIVIISAGNAPRPLQKVLSPNVIVVGGVSADGKIQSQFSSEVSCYGVVPYQLPGTNVPFGHSSAATAYVGGLVAMLLNYAKSKGFTLMSKHVVGILKGSGNQFDVLSDQGLEPGVLPVWPAVQIAIDKLKNSL